MVWVKHTPGETLKQTKPVIKLTAKSTKSTPSITFLFYKAEAKRQRMREMERGRAHATSLNMGCDSETE